MSRTGMMRAAAILGFAMLAALPAVLAGLGKNRNGPPAGATFQHSLECCRISHGATELALASYRVRRERAEHPAAPVPDDWSE